MAANKVKSEDIIETQRKQIVKHLRSGRKISTWEAIQRYGITRLAAVIHYLETNHKIPKTSRQWVQNSETGKRYVEYKIKKNAKRKAKSRKPTRKATGKKAKRSRKG